MKTAVVYYSLGGNTAFAAQLLAEGPDTDLIELRPVKAYPEKGLRKFLWGGKSAVMAETPKLEPYAFRAEEYDRVVFGFPVWAGNIAPPLRTFVMENREALSGKRLYAFACMGGSGADKAFAKLASCLGVESFAGKLVLVDPKDKPTRAKIMVIEKFRENLKKE